MWPFTVQSYSSSPSFFLLLSFPSSSPSFCPFTSLSPSPPHCFWIHSFYSLLFYTNPLSSFIFLSFYSFSISHAALLYLSYQSIFFHSFSSYFHSLSIYFNHFLPQSFIHSLIILCITCSFSILLLITKRKAKKNL